MIKPENLQIFFNVNRQDQITDVLLIDSSILNYQERANLTKDFRMSHGNICSNWLKQRTPQSFYAKFLRRGFQDKEAEEVSKNQFYQVDGMKDFLDHIYC